MSENMQAIVKFREENAALIESVIRLEVQKKQFEAQEKEFRDKLLKAMQTYGVWDIYNEGLTIQRIGASEREGIDTAKLKKEFPTIASKCRKVTPVRESVRITVK